MSLSTVRSRMAVLALCLSSVAVAACGSSSSSSSSSSAGGSSSAAGTSSSASSSGGLSSSQQAVVSAAKAAVAKYSQPQPAVVIAPLPGKPPTGLNVTIASCVIPVCKAETDPAVAAAKQLGWHVSTLQTDLTPVAYQTILSQILQAKPQYAAITPIVPNALVSKQLTQLAAQGTKVLEMAPPGDSPAGPVVAAVAGPPELALSGQLMGDAVVADAAGPAHTVFVWDPSFAATWGSVKGAFSKVVQGAGGSVDVLQVNFANIGKTGPSQVVTYLQAHPQVKYVAFAVADFAAGVPQALKAAGLSSQVKLVSRAPQAVNMADLKAGSEWVTVGEENAGDRTIDQIARLALHLPLTAEQRNPTGWHQIFNQSNVSETTAAPTAPGFPQAFLKAWHVS